MKNRKMAITILILACAVSVAMYVFMRKQTNHSERKDKNEAFKAQAAENQKKKKEILAGPGSNFYILDSRNNAQSLATEESPEKIAQVIADLHKLRANPSPESLKAVAEIMNNNFDRTILAEAVDTMGAIGLNGSYAQDAFNFLGAKAMDKGFPQHDQALVTAALVGKDQALPLVSQLLQQASEPGGPNAESKEVLSRALNIVSSPECVPLLTELIGQTSDPSTRRTSYEALAKIGTPEALSFLEQQVQSTKGTDQATSVLALSRADSPASREWVVTALQNDTLGDEAKKLLLMSKAAPEIFSQFLTNESIDSAKKISVLHELSKNMLTASGDVREHLALSITPLLYTDGDVQKEAIKLLGQYGTKETSEILFPFVYSSDPEVRKDAFFSYMGYTTPANYTYLYDFLDDSDQNTRRMAMAMIERFYSDADRSDLEKASASQDPYIRERAARLLSGTK